MSLTFPHDAGTVNAKNTIRAILQCNNNAKLKTHLVFFRFIRHCLSVAALAPLPDTPQPKPWQLSGHENCKAVLCPHTVIGCCRSSDTSVLVWDCTVQRRLGALCWRHQEIESRKCNRPCSPPGYFTNKTLTTLRALEQFNFFFLWMKMHNK